MFDDVSGIVEYEREREKAKLETNPETNQSIRGSGAGTKKMSFGKMLFFFFLGILIFRLCGELLRFIS